MSAQITTQTQNGAEIYLTQAAAERIQAFMAKDGGRGIHLDVRRTGCSGWAYELNIAHEPAKAGELVLVKRGVEIIITEQALSMMAGTVVDFVEEGLVREFRFKNPNVTAECGCGESFTIDPSV